MTCNIQYSPCHAQVRDVTKTYQSGGRLFRALDDISLDIEAGKLVALLGPSGSGAGYRGFAVTFQASVRLAVCKY